ncbi:hypothetical protein SOMG_01464 [Schizosaccharomyces osmophilus]|uniref:Uncharacterized protein n=1 Tax=Schizosaccharomyces osmophilus TaxID=2545709 RepID=A0AAE9WBI3_9SCHI|nr:uncharacterized protein SOMG_01464 [Schizosaccharomyces osmophilus]WBW72594.1 hypothetical protein SOMG_01464 [Schizosaccharomyces osmophilus]
MWEGQSPWCSVQDAKETPAAPWGFSSFLDAIAYRFVSQQNELYLEAFYDGFFNEYHQPSTINHKPQTSNLKPQTVNHPNHVYPPSFSVHRFVYYPIVPFVRIRVLHRSLSLLILAKSAHLRLL